MTQRQCAEHDFATLWKYRTLALAHIKSTGRSACSDSSAFFFFSRWLTKIIWLNYIFFFNEIFASFRNRTYINYSLDESTWSSSLSQLYHRLDDYVRKSRKFVFANMINNFEPQFQNDLWILLHKIMVNKGELLKWNETDFKLDFWHFLWHEI